MFSGLPAGMFCLKGHIDVPVERLEQVRNALKYHIELTRQEAGCVFFNVDPCPDVPGRFLVSEAFVDESAFKFHQERAGNSPWAEASAGTFRSYETWSVS